MNTKMVVTAFLVLVVLAGGFLYLNNMNTQQKAQMSNDEAMAKDDESMESIEEMEKDDKMMGDGMNDSRYVEYSKSVLDESVSNRRVLYFYASWCPTCKPADADFRANTSKIPEDVTVIRVNYNDPETDKEENDLARQYGITYQHTFVQIDGQGEVVTKWNGGQTEELLVKIK